MPGASRILCRLLLRMYPRTVREHNGPELEAAVLSCIAREQLRFGILGSLFACVRLILDALVAGAGIRLDERRARRLAQRHTLNHAPREGRMNSWWQDVKYAGRVMRRAPLFSIVVVITLALAIGATTAVFTVVHAVLLRSLPYAEPDRLVMLYQAIPKAIAGPIGFSSPDYLAFEQRASMFDSIAAYRTRDYELSGVEPPERITAARASASLFETLGVRPAIGSAYTRGDDEEGRPVAVLSYGLWTRKFAGDPAVIGRLLMLDRQPYTIIGVMPRHFTFPNRGPHLNNVPADVYLPIGFTAQERQAFGSMYNISVVARLKSGATAMQADADARALVRANAAEIYPAALRDLAEAVSASAVPLRDDIVGRTRIALVVAFAAVVLVLLIACADTASLILTRALSRQREMAVRAALGAGRGRIVRQLFVESSVLALLGGAVGLLLAGWMSRILASLAPATLPRLHEIAVDWRILLFSASVALLTAIICSLLPAFELSRGDSVQALKEGGRPGTSGRSHRRAFTTLVTAQIALAIVLLVAGGLLVRSFARLVSVDPGFRPEQTLTMETSLPVAVYPTGADVRAFYTRLIERIDGQPGIVAAGASTDLPLRVRDRRAFALENEVAAARELYAVAHEWVVGRYFEALGIPLKRGRPFSAQDHAASEPVAIINETMARWFWGDDDPVGHRLAWGGRDNHGPWMRIVGVVGDVKQGPLDSETVPQAYTPWLQAADSMLAENVVGMLRSMRLVVRTEGEPSALASTLRQQVRSVDPALAATNVFTMEEIIRTSTATERFNVMLIGLFGVLALLLAAIGIAGVLAMSISRRSHELGVRLALGAQRQALVAMVLREGLLLAGLGLAAGLPVALMLSRVMSTLLFEVNPRDPLTFLSVSALLVAVALAACCMPAWRATRIEPVVALRRE